MITRRKWIGMMAGAGALTALTSPGRRLLEKIVHDNARSDLFRPQLHETRNYVQINLYGAPSRLSFDSLLKPYDDSLFIPHPFVANRIVKQDKDDKSRFELEYSTTKIHGLNFPDLWNETVPGSDGSARRLSDLLENSLFIRGCRLDFEGHPLNGIQQISPVQGGLSLNGVIGDHSKSFISSVSVGSNPVSRAFKSEKSLLLEVPPGENNYADYILKPFLLEEVDHLFSDGRLPAAFDEIAKNYPAEFKDIAELRKQSLKYFQKNIDKFTHEFSRLQAKYTLLIKNAIETNEYFNVHSPGLPLMVDGKKTIKEILGPFSVEEKFFPEIDLHNFVKSGEFNYWAQEFALCEFLLVNNICQSVLICPPKETGDLITSCKSAGALNFQHIEEIYNPQTNKTTLSLKKNSELNKFHQTFPMDAHDTGVLFDVLTTKQFFRAISTCLYELISQLKNTKINDKTLFDETVIHIASEFDRNPSQDGYGSSHLPFSNPTSIFSGCLKGPAVIGNIYAGTLKKNDEEYFGTLGVGAPVKELGTAIKIGNVSSTLSTLLRVKPIVKRDPTLIDERTYRPIIERAQNMEGIS